MTFLKDHFDCCVENCLKRSKNGSREVSWEATSVTKAIYFGELDPEWKEKRRQNWSYLVMF